MQKKKLHSLAVFLTAVSASFFIPLAVNADDPNSLGPDCDCSEDKPHTFTNSNHPIRIRGGKHRIVLDGVNIPVMDCTDTDGTLVPAIEISQSTVSPYSASDVTIELKNANTLVSPDGHAGIQVKSGNTLKIIGDGTLNVTGGKGGAGIGNAGENDASGEIIIETEGNYRSRRFGCSWYWRWPRWWLR